MSKLDPIEKKKEKIKKVKYNDVNHNVNQIQWVGHEVDNFSQLLNVAAMKYIALNYMAIKLSIYMEVLDQSKI